MLAIAGGILIAFWVIMILGAFFTAWDNFIQWGNIAAEEWFNKHVYRNRNRNRNHQE